MASLDLTGFADPPTEAQACFRAVLDAMARPGRVVECGAGLASPVPLGAAMAATLLTLADAETPLWLAPTADAATDWLRFHCGAPLVEALPAASLVVALTMPSLATLALGTDEAPEHGATLLLQVAALGEGRGYRLAGPGLREPATLRVAGLPDDFAAQWRANHALFPRGVDLVLCSGTRLAALPRSVQVEEV